MKKFVLATAVAVMGASSATAADLAVRMPARAVANCPAAWFDGAYIGVNGGATLWSANRTDQDGAIVDSTTTVQKTAGALVGGQLGYNWTRCHTVIGVEVDGDWSGARVRTQYFPNAIPPVNININSHFDGLVTGRVRAGVALDNLLLYVTGGVAGGHFRTTWTNFAPAAAPPLFLQADISDWAWGFVAGLGVEWAWTDRLSVRGEALYVDFLDREHTALLPPLVPPAANFTHSDSMWLARIGLNLKLGAPVYVTR